MLDRVVYQLRKAEVGQPEVTTPGKSEGTAKGHTQLKPAFSPCNYSQETDTDEEVPATDCLVPWKTLLQMKN